MAYKLSLVEQETSITMNRQDQVAHIYTSDRSMMAKLDRLCVDYPDTYRCIWEDKVILDDGIAMSKKYEVAKKYIRFRKPVSDEYREARRRTCIFTSRKPDE